MWCAGFEQLANCLLPTVPAIHERSNSQGFCGRHTSQERGAGLVRKARPTLETGSESEYTTMIWSTHHRDAQHNVGTGKTIVFNLSLPHRKNIFASTCTTYRLPLTHAHTSPTLRHDRLSHSPAHTPTLRHQEDTVEHPLITALQERNKNLSPYEQCANNPSSKQYISCISCLSTLLHMTREIILLMLDTYLGTPRISASTMRRWCGTTPSFTA